MTKRKKHIIAGLSLIAVAGLSYYLFHVVKTIGQKEYNLRDLKLVVSNSQKCDVLLKSLQDVSKDQLNLKFSKAEKGDDIIIEQDSKKITNHSHHIAKQNVKDGLIYRVGTGNFELAGEKFEYVMATSTDLANPKYKHLYPMVFAGDEARCYFTALLEPNTETSEDFRESLKEGLAKDKEDLTKK